MEKRKELIKKFIKIHQIQPEHIFSYLDDLVVFVRDNLDYCDNYEDEKYDILNILNCWDFDDDYCFESIHEIYNSVLEDIKEDFYKIVVNPANYDELEWKLIEALPVSQLDDYGSAGDITLIKRIGNWCVWVGRCNNCDGLGNDFIGVWINELDCHYFDPWDYPMVDWYSFFGVEINKNSKNYEIIED